MTNRAYDFTLAAALGANQRLDARGTFVKVLSAPAGPVGVKLDGGQELELSDGMVWRMPPGQTFREVTVRNLQAVANAGRIYVGEQAVDDTRLRRAPVLLMETDVNPVAAGSGPGWVSGTIANLAASGNATIVFDLGADWAQYGVVELTVYPSGASSGLNPVQFYGSDTTVANSARRRGAAFATGSSAFFINMATASGPASFVIRPAGRYFIVTATNADAANPQSAGAKVTLTAFPS